jgi:hypothetical protein
MLPDRLPRYSDTQNLIILESHPRIDHLGIDPTKTHQDVQKQLLSTFEYIKLKFFNKTQTV